MPTGEERRLKLIKGQSGPGVSRAGRTVTRRTVARRPASPDSVEEILRRLDQEPAVVPPAAEPVDRSDTADPADRSDSANPAEQPDTADPADPADRLETPGPARRWWRPRLGLRAGQRPTGRVRGPSPVTALLTAALCLALIAAGFAGHRWYQDRALEQARQQALAAARQTTVNFVSISASSVDRDLGRIVAGATGEFKEQFTRGQDQVRAAVVENKVESRGTVLRAGLLSSDRGAAVALVAVDATVANVHAPQGRDSHYRIQVDLTRDRDSGDWLVSRLQFVG